MKHIYIHCPLLPASDYRQVLERLCPESVRNITVYTHCPAKTSRKQLEALVQVQKDFSEERLIRFQNIALFDQLPHLRKSLRIALRKNGFTVELQVQLERLDRLVPLRKRLEKSGISYKFRLDEARDQMAAYRLFAEKGLSVHFADPVYTADTPALFDKWLYDPAAQGINTFTDIINMLLMQTHSPNCRHASCFGNTFYVDGQLDVYLCPHHPDQRTRLGGLMAAQSLNKLLNCQTVAALLPTAVQKRQQCADGCSTFAYCQGGCPLEAAVSTDCTHYGATVTLIRSRLLEIYREGKLRQVNYVVKNAILNALAFGTAFFN